MGMKNVEKYTRQYFMPPVDCMDWAKKDHIEKAPIWCSVDLRDGNQALIVPMSLEQKLEFFKLLVRIGFKEIEVGFPAASETEYLFLRTLIEKNMIPDDVTIQVLTQAREHIIRKTFEALQGVKKAVVHVYNSTSVAQREQVFKKSKEEILKIAVDGAELLKKLAERDRRKLSVSSTARRASPEPRWSTLWRSAMPFWMYGSRPRITKCIINLPSHRGALHASRLCQPGRVYEQKPEIPRQRYRFPASPQRPRLRHQRCRDGNSCRRRPY